ncbi:Oxidoreductase boa17 [Arthrobotrys conoides]|uniref:Oxidoreductase boa17 n=1 Tax=Arthrobotrys conoides TaxID=74498 RepID=A0AAN8N7E1_9PEZI
MTKVWFITGSSRGLGRAIVEAVLQSGASVIATARDPKTLEKFSKSVGTSRFLALEVDVTNENEIIHAINTGYEKFGRIDIVVNNAGYANLASVEDINMQDFRAQWETNFMGVVHTSKAVLPILRRQGSGHIFQISSLGGRVASPGLTAYQSAKWAVGGFSTGLAQEVAPFGIKVTVLEPGGIRTDWAGSSMQVPAISEPYQQTVGAFAQFLRDFSGKEPSLPDKIAQIIVDLSDADDVPLRLLIGTDAVDYAAKAAKDLLVADQKWHDVSISSV